MKVLFAVNSESVSDAIIKKYQRDYREILSYKNVYYFNAIQKEIQKDKTYDRIVISVDLEPFSSNNYESIDKFIFEKLDGISDEAHDMEGNEVPIILICSDRHTKGSSFLVKLFGLGIYNALLGNDRSMEEVCRLINKTRTKKEAKMYYKIDTEDVDYRTQNEDEVDELQIQNILFHFRKLGKNTEKYASSFENIAMQYTDEQLKIIMNCLPANVKRVLERTSSKYQEIMAASGVMVQGVKSSDVEDKEDQKRTGLKIDIIENKMNQNKMNGPIVIPNSVKSASSANAKKVIAVPQKPQNNSVVSSEPVQKTVKKVTPELKNESANTDININAKKANPTNQNQKGKLVRLPDGRIVRKKVVSKPTATENEATTKQEIEETPKTVKPERRTANFAEKETPKSDPFDELEDMDFPGLDFGAEVPENKTNLNTSFANQEEIEEVDQPKKGRGRPRKNPVAMEPKPKGKRGRPRKNPIEEIQPERKEEETQDELPDLETITEEQLNFATLEEDELNPAFEEETQNDDFEDFLVDDEEDLFSNEETVNEPMENKLQEPQLPELDELDDFDEFDDEDEFSGLTEDSFDEFEDYDEYGQYETAKLENSQQEDIDELYEEDILSDEDDDFEELEDSSDLPGFDELNELDELDDSEDFAQMDTENDNTLLSDFEEAEAEDILSVADDNDQDDLLDFGEEEDLLTQEDNALDNEEDIFDENYNNDTSSLHSQETFDDNMGALESVESPMDYSMSNLNSLMTKDKKIVTFLGSTKNGVSFLVNNLAEIFASVGINTAILDMTKNRNSYYIYTQNEESLRQIAYQCFDKLQNGVAEGIRVKQNLTVYTALPNDGKDYPNVEAILSTLVQSHSLVLIDCDYDTNPAYFASCQEIYLVQSMDILTIQPLTAFLRDLKTQGVFEPEKVRVVINKELKVRGLTNKAIIGGMSSYNDPAMSFMTELFDKESVKYCSIPFEEMVYSKYLEGMLNCKVSISGYSKNFMNKLRILGDMVYPLTSRQTYSSNTKQSYKTNNFSSSMNDTLNKMKKKY